MDVLTSAIASIVVALVGGVATWQAQRIVGKAQKDTAEATTRANEWPALFDEMKEWTKERLAERDERINSLQEQVTGLQSKFDAVQTKYRAALHVLAQWMVKHPGAAREIDVPEEIRSDLLSMD